MKYKFKKSSFQNLPVKFRKELLDEIKEIGEKEDVLVDDVIDGLLRVAVKEYWNERKVSATLSRKLKKKRKRGRPKSDTKVIKPGMSPCQYSDCPNGEKDYLVRNMTPYKGRYSRYDGFFFCSEECRDKFKSKQRKMG